MSFALYDDLGAAAHSEVGSRIDAISLAGITSSANPSKSGVLVFVLSAKKISRKDLQAINRPKNRLKSMTFVTVLNLGKLFVNS